MSNKAQETILKARQELDEKYVENGAVKVSNLWYYVQYTQAIDILEDVIDNADDDDDEVIDNYLDNINKTFDDIIEYIATDDYIIPDWNSNTDYHEYTTDVIELIKQA